MSYYGIHRLQIAPSRCSKAGCRRFHHARGLCKTHYDALMQAEKRIKLLESIINDEEMFPK